MIINNQYHLLLFYEEIQLWPQLGRVPCQIESSSIDNNFRTFSGQGLHVAPESFHCFFLAVVDFSVFFLLQVFLHSYFFIFLLLLNNAPQKTQHLIGKSLLPYPLPDGTTKLLSERTILTLVFFKLHWFIFFMCMNVWFHVFMCITCVCMWYLWKPEDESQILRIWNCRWSWATILLLRR